MTDITPPPPSVPAPPPPPSPRPPGGYPVVVELERDYEVQNWRALVNWILVIPHAVVLYALQVASRVLWLISFFTILFTKKNPFIGFQTMVFRYSWRVASYALFMRNEYPPFDFGTTPGTEQADSALLTIQDPGEMNRWLVLVKWLLAIPQFIVLVFLGIAVFFVWIVSFFAVLFTGKWPAGLRDFVVGVTRWSLRVSAYITFLTDEYPPFSLH